MAKRKGIIQVTSEELARVQLMVDTNYSSAENLHRKANKLREHNPNDFKAIKEATELVEEARHYENIADNLVKNDVFIAQRSLDERKEHVRKFKLYVDGLKDNLTATKHESIEMNKRHQQELDQSQRDIDNAAWHLQQAQEELDDLEGV